MAANILNNINHNNNHNHNHNHHHHHDDHDHTTRYLNPSLALFCLNSGIHLWVSQRMHVHVLRLPTLLLRLLHLLSLDSRPLVVHPALLSTAADARARGSANGSEPKPVRLFRITFPGCFLLPMASY